MTDILEDELPDDELVLFAHVDHDIDREQWRLAILSAGFEYGFAIETTPKGEPGARSNAVFDAVAGLWDWLDELPGPARVLCANEQVGRLFLALLTDSGKGDRPRNLARTLDVAPLCGMPEGRAAEAAFWASHPEAERDCPLVHAAALRAVVLATLGLDADPAATRH